MEVFYVLWGIITLFIYMVYRNADITYGVDLQYFLNETFPEELPTT